jgi:hypothetical protein
MAKQWNGYAEHLKNTNEKVRKVNRFIIQALEEHFKMVSNAHTTMAPVLGGDSALMVSLRAPAPSVVHPPARTVTVRQQPIIAGAQVVPAFVSMASHCLAGHTGPVSTVAVAAPTVKTKRRRSRQRCNNCGHFKLEHKAMHCGSRQLCSEGDCAAIRQMSCCPQPQEEVIARVRKKARRAMVVPGTPASSQLPTKVSS